MANSIEDSKRGVRHGLLPFPPAVDNPAIHTARVWIAAVAVPGYVHRSPAWGLRRERARRARPSLRREIPDSLVWAGVSAFFIHQCKAPRLAVRSDVVRAGS